MINKETYAEQIYAELKQDILHQRISFGDKLINRELQARFHVSSTPVRDAINRLYLDGFVEGISKSGAKVIDFDLEFAIEINEIVALLCDQAIKLSAQKAAHSDVAALLASQIALQAQNRDNDDYYIYDNEFHLAFFRFAHNRRFRELYQRYNTLQDILIRYAYAKNDAHKDLAIRQHQAIYEAYRAGDIARARRLMEEHYATAVSQIRMGFPAMAK